MRLHLIACQVFNRELSYYCSQSSNIVDITWLPQGLHDTPDLLRKMVREAVENIHTDMENRVLKHTPEAILLGYGLCSNGVTGIRSYELPIIVPRTDDCIGIFLGSQKRYLELFKTYNGTYWLNNGWIETAFIPSEKMLGEKRDRYVEDYGEENADFLMEQDNLWSKNYSFCGYITSKVYNNPDYLNTARQVAQYNGWDLACFDGDTRLIEKMVAGDWNEDEFLICPPNHQIEPSYDEGKLKAIPL